MEDGKKKDGKETKLCLTLRKNEENLQHQEPTQKKKKKKKNLKKK